MPYDEPWVYKPPEVIGQVVGEITTLHIAIDGGEHEGKQHRSNGHRSSFGNQRKEKNPASEKQGSGMLIDSTIEKEGWEHWLIDSTYRERGIGNAH
jgi:hypothetical protein